MKLSKWVGLRVVAHNARGDTKLTGVVLKTGHEKCRGEVLTLDTGHSIVAGDVIKTLNHPKAFYVSSYCNFAHSMKNGAPIKHECRYLPTAALRLEREGYVAEAIEILRKVRG